MNKEEFANLLVKLTFDKAKKDGKHPLEILEEVMRLIEQKQKIERLRIIQAVENLISAN